MGIQTLRDSRGLQIQGNPQLQLAFGFCVGCFFVKGNSAEIVCIVCLLLALPTKKARILCLDSL
jgi:hypothetical protein